MFDRVQPDGLLDRIDDLIYRWRGIANWPEAEATVFSCSWVPNQESGGGWYDVVFTYRVGGELQRGSFRTGGTETTSPYFRGDVFTLRYNPKRPKRFYYAAEPSLRPVLVVGVILVAAIPFLVKLLSK